MDTYNYEVCPQGMCFADNGLNINYIFLCNHITERLAENKRIKILEIGAGGGRNLRIIYQKFGSKVELFGTDISNTAIDYAKSLEIGKFYLAKSEIIPVAEKFDLILMIDILEHLKTKSVVKKTLDNALLYLNDGGNIYISLPIELNRFSLTWLFSKLHYFKNLTKMFWGHLIQFNIKGFLKLIDLNKFKLEEAFYSVHFLSQLQILCFFYLPKILLQFFFGKKIANDLRDSNEIINNIKHPLLNLAKRIIINFSYPLSYLAFKESHLKRTSSFAVGNMHLLISKDYIK
ncbi:MAG: methyltransferase domain-containing protein [bacterium]|nr:methyltransferase domain-containing protein [bacterium]